MKLTEAQEAMKKEMHLQMESLRDKKEALKQQIAECNEQIFLYDVEIKRLRIAVAQIQPIPEPRKPRKHVETPEEKLARLEKECDTLRASLGVST